MTFRVSTFAQSQLILAASQRQQDSVQKSQLQLASGKKDTSYAGYGAQSGALVSALSLKATAQSHAELNSQLGTRLDLTAVQLEQLYGAASSVRDNLRTALAQNRADGLAATLDADLKTSAAALNSMFNGSYLFGGARGTTAPVPATSLAELAALPNTNGLFQNDTLVARAQISDGVSVAVGTLASDVGAPLFASLHALAQVHQNTPLTGALSATQSAALSAQLAGLDAAISQIQSAQGALGVTQAQVSAQAVQAQNRVDDLAVYVSNIEDVNIAEVITQLRANQTALEASYKITSELSQLSLLKYI